MTGGAGRQVEQGFTAPWEGSHGKFYMGEATERKTYMLILGGLHERQTV
jgi:hypothetical protein